MTLQNFRRCFVVLDWLGRWICVVRIDYQWWLLIGREREENLLQNYVRFKLVHFLYLQCATPRCWASKDDAGVSLKYLWVRKGLVDWRWRAGLLWVLQTQILLFFLYIYLTFSPASKIHSSTIISAIILPKTITTNASTMAWYRWLINH